ncbi:hypothetical protein [Janthinobacterium fluminis]|uniref:Uncharacterized protein n=1 Tax=Janthinobacterium fluminis TaxID=2987524 RepID=A0ABT5K1D1_9BURK|nr:hypothetical protein [Janthinobacterium fluminis]MDC8758260.1 hypothetical protein [Janthinobacterium fluminis]
MQPTLSLLLAATLGSAAHAAEVRCLISSDARPPIRLQFTFPEGKKLLGQVRYERGSAAIPVKRLSSTTIDAEPDRPWSFETTWRETTAGGGSYTMLTQGARVYAFSYTGAKGKTTTFLEDLEASGERGCEWRRAG